MSTGRGVMWMLTSGEYSDWSVHGVYTDEAEADKAAELANLGRRGAYEDEYRAEEVAVLDGTMPRRAELINVSGFPLKDGKANEYPRGTRVVFGRQADTPYVNYDEGTGSLYIFGETEVARKVYSERAARIKADAEGITR